jgi:alkylation response protein AidB-like acyl-CoA dehydrogenase
LNFTFSEEQIAFRDQMRSFAEKECTPEDVREAWASPTGWSQRRWKALAELGVVGLTVPQAHGGMGLGQVDLVLLLEEAGRACLPEPLVETVATAVPLLASCPGERAEEIRSRWMAPVAEGEAVVAFGASRDLDVGAAAGADTPAAEGSHMPAALPSGVAAASAPDVHAADGSKLLVLEHREPGKVELHALETAAVTLTSRVALDATRRPCSVVWEPSAASLIAEGEEAQRLVHSASDRAANAAAAVLAGVADRLISMSGSYAIERKQFGKAIGSFQAVKHQLANALIRLEFVRPLVYRAAWSLDSGEPDAGLHVSMAKAQASEAALLAARTALQVHGAIGYTWEHDLHLWMKRAWALAAAWGDAASHRGRVLDSLVAREA